MAGFIMGEDGPSLTLAATPSGLKLTARIVVDIDANGAAWLRGEFAGRSDSSYASMLDARLLTVEIPKLLTELRAQLADASGVTE
jgi:hypothetical protein